VKNPKIFLSPLNLSTNAANPKYRCVEGKLLNKIWSLKENN
jgi:hypothetical protein